MVKGKTKPVAVYEVLDYHTEETYPHLIDALGYFRDGLAKYRQRKWNDAVKRFSRSAGDQPGRQGRQALYRALPPPRPNSRPATTGTACG